MSIEADVNEALDSVIGQPLKGAKYVEEYGIVMLCFPMKDIFFHVDEQTFALRLEAPH